MLRRGKKRRERDWKDFSLPGYKYLGPGNRLDKGEPNNESDRVAQAHDVEYDKYLKAGHNPYMKWNEADEEFLKKAKNDYGGLLGKGFFGMKKLAHKAGLVPAIEPAKKALASRRAGRGPLRPKMDFGDEPETASQANLRGVAQASETTTTMADGGRDGGGSGNDAGLKETPVDDPYMVYRGPPDETFCSLPFLETQNIEMADVWSVDHVYRMTSPYDPRVYSTNSDINAGAGTAIVWTSAVGSPDADPAGPPTNVHSARWWDYYASLYAYYHVISCRYSIFVENFSGENLWVHMMFANDEVPPTGATNEDIMLWSGVKTHMLKGVFNAIIGGTGLLEKNDRTFTGTPNAPADEDDPGTSGANTYESSTNVVSRGGIISCQFDGEYRPGQFKRQIILDAQVENWTTTNTNPALTERLIVRIKPENPSIETSGTNVNGDDLKYKITAKLEYLVEFKELKPELRWPVRRQPATVTVSADFGSTA